MRTSKEITIHTLMRPAVILTTFLLCLFAFGARSAQAESINSFSSMISTTHAGGHPNIVTSFALEEPGIEETARNITVSTPAGIFGNPQAISQCTSLDFALTQCPSASQAGLITVRANYNGEPNYLLGTAPVYDLKPGDKTAMFGFTVPTIDLPIQIPIAVRTGSDYGLRFTVSNITQLVPLAEAQMTFWAFPALESHDVERFPKGEPGEPSGCPGLAGTGCIASPTTAGITVHPLIDDPTVCTEEPLPVELDVQTYQHPDQQSHAETTYPPISECEKETFKPVLYARPTTEEADSAAGLDIELIDPQPLSFAATPSELHSASVTLPEGLTVNPDAADGQSACADSQANFGSEAPAECPDQAKIGTIGVHSSALEGTMEGSIYIGEPKPGDQYRLFLVVDGFGMHAKFIGSVRPDPQTGRVSVFFDDLPQVPFDAFDVHLFASDRGLMATPTSCGIYTTAGVFYPWNTTQPEVTSKQIFEISEGPNGSSCPNDIRPFAPKLSAGTTSSVAGSHTSFALQLDREDGDQFLGELNFTMPPGLTGSLRGITYCPEASIAAAAQRGGRAEQASPSCPESSLIGTTNVAAGPGSHPFHVTGRMYLAGPFKGAPLSLVAVTPALAGPYDYGTQVVRVAIHVDPLDAHVFAASDTVPSIIGGIPLRLRSIRVSIDRPNFMINPTNCSPFSVLSQGIGDQGTVANFSSYFHVDNCLTLPFAPTMRIKQLGGRKGTSRAAYPALQFDLNTREGDANIKSLSVTLPNAFEIAQEHLANLCTEKLLVETQCAGKQQIGEATTTTPLLDQPLSGPVYAVSGSGGLPRLAFILNGQVDLLPRAESKTAKGGLKTTVPVVPDAPIGHFHLIIFGGKHGYLTNTRSLCGKPPVVKIQYSGQNDLTRSESVMVKSPCAEGRTKAKRHHRGSPNAA